MMLIICITYLRVVILTIGCLRLLRLIVVLELLSWLFVIVIPSTSTLNYLIVQRYFLILRLCSVLFLPSILVIRFFIKLGMPPFHIWFIRIAITLLKRIFSFIMTVHKLLPILFIRKILLRFVSFRIVSLRLFIVGIALIRRRTLFFTLMFSSIVHTIWIIFGMFLRKSFVLFYWSRYRLLFIILIRLLRFIKIDQSYLSQSLFISKCWLLISGIPPFIIFWFKVHLVIWLVSIVGLFMRIIIILVRVFALTSYYRTWHFGSLLEYNRITLASLGPILIVLVFWRVF